MLSFGNIWGFVIVIVALILFSCPSGFLGFLWDPSPINTSHKWLAHLRSRTLATSLHLPRIWITTAEEETVPNWCYLPAKCRLPRRRQLPTLFGLISFPKSGSSVFPVFWDYSYFSSVYFFHLSQLRSFLLLATKWFIIKNDSKIPVLSRIRLPKGRARINISGSAHCGSPEELTPSCRIVFLQEPPEHIWLTLLLQLSIPVTNKYISFCSEMHKAWHSTLGLLWNLKHLYVNSQPNATFYVQYLKEMSDLK